MYIDEACAEFFSFWKNFDIWNAFGAGSLKPWQIWSTDSAILMLERRRPDVSTSSLMVHTESGFSGNRNFIRASEVYPPGFGLEVLK